MPDLTTVVRNCCFPASSGTTALFGAVLPLDLERYYRSLWSGTTAWAVLVRAFRGTTAACQVPSCSCHTLILLLCLLAYARSFWLFCVFLCLVPGDEHAEHKARRVNPGRATAKCYRTSELAGGSSSTQPPPAGASASAPPPPQQTKRSANKPKGKTVTEMTAK